MNEHKYIYNEKQSMFCTKCKGLMIPTGLNLSIKKDAPLDNVYYDIEAYCPLCDVSTETKKIWGIFTKKTQKINKHIIKIKLLVEEKQ